MAVNCLAKSKVIVGLAGLTAIEVKVGFVTVKVVEALLPSRLAVMRLLPTATGVARPLEPLAVLIVTTEGVAEIQVTEDVKFCVVLSEYIPVAENCLVRPRTTPGLVGLTEIDTRVALLTVKAVEALTVPDVAVIVLLPEVTAMAMPLEPAALLTVATERLDELQVTADVRLCDVLSEYIPVAMNCLLSPKPTIGLVGLTEMDTSVAPLTVKVVDPLTLPDKAEAEIVVLPCTTELANPLIPLALLIVATARLEELQVTESLIFCVVLSE